MRKPIIVVLAALALVLAFGGAARAGESRPAIGGRVASITGSGVMGARVYLRNATTGFVLESAVTLQRGEFSMPGVPPGPYEYFVVTTLGAYLGRQIIDTSITPRLTVDLRIGPPARGEELPRAEQFPKRITVQPAGYAEVRSSDVRGLNRGAKTKIAVGASAGGLAIVALVLNILDDDEQAATVVLVPPPSAP